MKANLQKYSHVAPPSQFRVPQALQDLIRLLAKQVAKRLVRNSQADKSIQDAMTEKSTNPKPKS
jgi:hypothetical protein